MLTLLTTPANNERGPRYMEKALAAVHQARPRSPVTLLYAAREGQVGLFLRCDAADRDAVLEPVRAGYPQGALQAVDEGSAAAGNVVWSRDVVLVPELFPILRHAQFEDLLNHTFADPVSGLLRAVLPGAGVTCRIEITVRPASRRRCRGVREAVKLLDREFFRRHHRLAGHHPVDTGSPGGPRGRAGDGPPACWGCWPAARRGRSARRSTSRPAGCTNARTTCRRRPTSWAGTSSRPACG